MLLRFSLASHTDIYCDSVVISNFSMYSRKLALDEANVNRSIQGCRLILIPSTLCLDVISRRKAVKWEGKHSAVADAILVLCGHIPHAYLLWCTHGDMMGECPVLVAELTQLA